MKTAYAPWDATCDVKLEEMLASTERRVYERRAVKGAVTVALPIEFIATTADAPGRNCATDGVSASEPIVSFSAKVRSALVTRPRSSVPVTTKRQFPSTASFPSHSSVWTPGCSASWRSDLVERSGPIRLAVTWDGRTSL